ncbi:MAG: 4-hydroxythreonine-4-phosphate dehydrogenase PdxA [Bacteroidaceae bacterium]|nr:4-hydroxythreonine-4-phosphate dehydrogenase PdxA [Bacteroidaceae bacterium]
MANRLLRVGITQGDINGVGLEIVLKTFAVPEMLGLCTPVIYGVGKALAYHRKALDMQLNVAGVRSAEDATDGRVNMVSLSDEEVPITLGQPSPEAGAAAFAALERAVADLRAGHIDVLVTAPVSKGSIPGFSGHTEYIEAQMRQAAAPVATGEPPVLPPADDDELPPPPPFEGEAPRPVTPPLPRNEALIMLMNSQMRIALVTSHLPLREVANAITQESLVRKLRAFDHSLRRDFTITRPRIAVLGLNPHAGDNGNLGSEEQTVIRPAIEEATRMGVHAHGPYAADSFFGTRAYEHFDGVLAMYHDQGLASFKALAMENGINFTAGLDVVRTAPDLGVSYDIAGKGVADETPFREAIYAAIDIHRNRIAWDEGHENPLRKLYHERKEDERPFGRQPQMRL